MATRIQARLADFPVSVELATRFDDMDLQGHINNVAIANLYQESRLRFHGELFEELRKGLRRQDNVGTVLADIHIAYGREAHYPAPVTVGCGISRVGNTSYTIHSAMFQAEQFQAEHFQGKELQGEQCLGTCETVLVYIKDGKPHPIPADEREVLLNHQLPEASA